VAGKAVKFTPLVAGRVAGNLPSGTVPVPRLFASRSVILPPLTAGSVPVIWAAGIAVKLAADPLGDNTSVPIANP
jgi:hypothetical protein